MSTLCIEGLRAAIAGKEILRGVDLEVHSGEVHAVMGPNGAGKSTLGNVLMGHPAYEVLGGSVRLDGVELLGLPTWERARHGLFLAPQDPMELPGVPLLSLLSEAHDNKVPLDELERRLAEEADAIKMAPAMLTRPVNVDSSGGEKKRMETLQLSVLRPRIAVLDELDSGLDVDALRDVARCVATRTKGGAEALGVLVITHYKRLLTEIAPDAVHVRGRGRVIKSGGAELADELERSGYSAYLTEQATAV